MKGSPRTEANRSNARRSTGPKTAAGKTAVAKNALRHGLAVPITRDPHFAEEISRLAEAIAGENASLARRDCATRVAEAHLDVMRIRERRRALLEDPKERVGRLRMGVVKQMLSWIKIKYRVDERTYRARLRKAPEGSFERFELDMDLDAASCEMIELVDGRGPAAEPPSLVEGLDVLAPKLARLDRYERRALSRRRRAIREFDALALAEGAEPVGSDLTGAAGAKL